MNRITINSLGLALDIIGALMIWYFVAEVNYASKREFLRGNAEIDLADPSPEQISSYKNRVRLSRVGMGLLVLGFLLQLLSNYAA
jgi:hypothetical protein